MGASRQLLAAQVPLVWGALWRARGVRAAAARELGVGRTTLVERIRIMREEGLFDADPSELVRDFQAYQKREELRTEAFIAYVTATICCRLARTGDQ